MASKTLSKNSLFIWGLLIIAGFGWGGSLSLTKMAATSAYHPMTLMFWQLVISVIILVSWLIASRTKLPLSWPHIRFYVVAAVIGTLAPNSLSYIAAPLVPVGIISVIYALIPMMTFALAVIFSAEKFDTKRFFGVLLGLAAVLMIILPKAELAQSINQFYLLFFFGSAFCYASEGVFATFYMPRKDHALTLLAGMSIAGLLMLTPSMVVANISFEVHNWRGIPEWALFGSTLIHIGCYATLLFLIAQTGPIFASQISYIVTISGVLWGIVIFSEVHSHWVWMAIITAMVGLFFVRQRAEKPIRKRQNFS